MPGAPCFTDITSSTTRSSILTLSFVPGSGDDFINAVKQQARFVDDHFGVKYHVEGRQVETIGEMKSGKWVAYAARALVIRFWDLAKVCCFHTLGRHPVLIMRSSTESRLTRYRPRTRWLHSDACDIHPFIPVFPCAWLQLLVDDSDHIFLDPGIHACSSHIPLRRHPA